MDEQKAKEFKNWIQKWALQSVQTWQSPDIQQALREQFSQPLTKYKFTQKFTESVKSVWDCLNLPIDSAVLSDVQKIGQRLEDRAIILFRDATLKNQILEVGAFVDLSLFSRDKISEYFPMANNQWFDPDMALKLLEQVPDIISWKQISDHIWHVDFEMASMLTTPEDDFIHILGLEILCYDYNKIIKIITEYLPDEQPERFHETTVFRFFRGWARRLAYAYNCCDVYISRYRHESLDHYYNLALTAITHLQENLGGCLQHLMVQAKQKSNFYLYGKSIQ